jgi:hypothetical protein
MATGPDAVPDRVATSRKARRALSRGLVLATIKHFCSPPGFLGHQPEAVTVQIR